MRLNKVRQSTHAAVVLIGLAALGACAPDTTEKQAALVSESAATLTAQELVANAIAGLGGEQTLQELKGLAFHSERDYFIMGQGPGPGNGLMKLARASMDVSHDLAGNRLKLHTISQFAARGGGYDKRESSELIIGQDGYLNEDDFLGIGKRRNKPSKSDRTASTLKTEKLLNPHFILQQVIANPSLASVGSSEDVYPTGRRFSVADAMPVTIDRVRQTGKRMLIATSDWLKKSQGTRFHDAMVEKVEINDDWLAQWQKELEIDAAAHELLVIEDDVYPITLYIDKNTGLISKLRTMEWDVVFGDVPLEVKYDDWQDINGIMLPSRIRVAIAGAPRIDITRSELQSNPEFAANEFTPPDGVEYVHDQEVATRARYLSQSLLMFGAAGVGRPNIESIELKPGITLLYAAPADGIYTFVVEQENGIVVMEPGQNDLKGEEVIKWLSTNIADKPITHVVVSHHHNDHAAGIRPYIAVGAELVVHKAAEDFYITQTSRPESVVLKDALDRNPKPAKIIGVAEDQVFSIEDSRLPVDIYPLEMAHVPDMMFAFVRGDNVLYAGDLYISGLARDLRSEKKRAPEILPFHAAVSLNEGILKHKLDIDMLVGSHDRQTVTYSDLINYLSDE